MATWLSGESRELAQFVQQTEMLRILECPVCNEVPFSHIFMCLKGHSICKNCKSRLSKCPLCAAKFSEARNFLAEDMISNSLHACSYKEDGCKVVEKGDLIEKHIEICQYKPGECPIYWKQRCLRPSLKYNQIRQHLIDKHYCTATAASDEGVALLKLFASEVSAFPDEIFVSKIVIVQFDGKEFLVCLSREEHDDIFYLVVLRLGPEHENDYQVKIEVKAKNGLKLTWDLPFIHSIFERTIESYICDEHDIFKPTCHIMDLKHLGVPGNNDNPAKKFLDTTMIFSKIGTKSLVADDQQTAVDSTSQPGKSTYTVTRVKLAKPQTYWSNTKDTFARGNHCFRVSREGSLVSCAFFGPPKADKSLEIHLKLMNHDRSTTLGAVEKTFVQKKIPDLLRISFKKPVQLKPDVWYTISFAIKGSRTLSGNAKPKYKVVIERKGQDPIVVTFLNSELDNSVNQLPELCFEF